MNSFSFVLYRSSRVRTSTYIMMIGEKLGNYTIIAVVGNGTMGTVYKAEDSEGRPVALKHVRSQILYNMEKRERFLQCLLIASGLRHKGICPILEIGDDNDDFFVITPFIDGVTLARYLEKKPLRWSQALHLASQIGSALAAIHDAGAAHRGLKPANIWILNNPEGSVLLSDCCIARFTELTSCGRMRSSGLGVDFADTLIPLGAMAYMSPEQVRGEFVDYRTDIFSFGVILYEMLSGRHPFDARSSLAQISAILEAEPPLLLSKQSSIPTQLEPVIRKALAKNREDRYQSVAELLDDLDSAAHAPTVEAGHPQTPSGIRKWFLPRFWKH